MANLKIFVSSTCYDMQAIRAQLRSLLISCGYEPVMSDQADVIYDPRAHTHTSCLREVANCDMVVLVVGSRFGGATIPKALETIDLEHVIDLSRADRFGEDKTRISITQAEVLQAIQGRIPVFAFVDSGVMRDHLTYEKNKNKSIIKEIEFSSIDKAETAPYIFEFINFLRLRNENNSIFEFSRFEDIENQIKKQWSGLFQRLLHEQREKIVETRRIDNLSSQIADLKAAIIGSISNDELKATAKGAIRFRTLLDFIQSITRLSRPNEVNSLIDFKFDWKDLLNFLGVAHVVPSNGDNRMSAVGSTVLIKDDGTYFKARMPFHYISRFSQEWADFKELGGESKKAILNAILDSTGNRAFPLVRYFDKNYVAEEIIERGDEEIENSKPAEVLLTKERFIEQSLQLYVTSVPEFKSFRFLFSAETDSVEVSFGSQKESNELRKFSLKYSTPSNGDMKYALEELKKGITENVIEILREIVEKQKTEPVKSVAAKLPRSKPVPKPNSGDA